MGKEVEAKTKTMTYWLQFPILATMQRVGRKANSDKKLQLALGESKPRCVYFDRQPKWRRQKVDRITIGYEQQVCQWRRTSRIPTPWTQHLQQARFFARRQVRSMFE
jgi:hypothetical protein